MQYLDDSEIMLNLWEKSIIMAPVGAVLHLINIHLVLITNIIFQFQFSVFGTKFYITAKP